MVWSDLTKSALLSSFGLFLGNYVIPNRYILQNTKIFETLFNSICFCRENITSLERRIADANKRIVEAEFQLNKLNEEIAKEKVRTCLIEIEIIKKKYSLSITLYIFQRKTKAMQKNGKNYQKRLKS